MWCKMQKEVCLLALTVTSHGGEAATATTTTTAAAAAVATERVLVGQYKPFLSPPLGTGAVAAAMPLVVSWLAVSFVTTEPLSLLLGVSRALSFLACLVPL